MVLQTYVEVRHMNEKRVKNLPGNRYTCECHITYYLIYNLVTASLYKKDAAGSKTQLSPWLSNKGIGKENEANSYEELQVK